MRITGKERPQGYSKRRIANGAVSALLLVVLIAHAVAGSLRGLSLSVLLPSWIPWAGVCLVGAHVLLCIATSYEQLADTVRPPSIQKKRHLVLKWVTGAAVALCAVVHVVSMKLLGQAVALWSVAGAAVTVVLAGVLAAHIWTGSKSLLKDLGIPKRFRAVVRVLAVALGGFCICAALLALLAHG